MCALFFCEAYAFFAKFFVNVQNRASLYNEQDILWSNFCATNLVIMQLWGLIKQIWNFVFRRVGVQMGSKWDFQMSKPCTIRFPILYITWSYMLG